jgi:NarL family two-component system response regulator LiaR
MKKVRILVADDENLVREGFVTILSLQPDLEVIGEAHDGIQAIQIAQKAKPDVVLLDMIMPEQDGLETIPKLKEILPECRILVLTSFAESDRVYQAIKSGALGYLLKDATRAQLLQAIRDVAEGRASIQPSIAMRVIHDIDNPSEPTYTADPLTPRELEVLRLIARGMSNREIAAELVINNRTVAKHVSSILDKLQLANRTQAALYAKREGLTEPRDKIKK